MRLCSFAATSQLVSRSVPLIGGAVNIDFQALAMSRLRYSLSETLFKFYWGTL